MRGNNQKFSSNNVNTNLIEERKQSAEEEEVEIVNTYFPHIKNSSNKNQSSNKRLSKDILEETLGDPNNSVYKNPPNSEKTRTSIDKREALNKSESLIYLNDSRTSESASFRNSNNYSSFRKNMLNKKFIINQEELYEQFFELYFTKIFNFNNFSESEGNANLFANQNPKGDLISGNNLVNVSVKSIHNNNNDQEEELKIKDEQNLLKLNNSELISKLKFEFENDKEAFEEQHRDFILKLSCFFKFISDDKLIELLNLMVKKQKEIHVFQFLNALYLFNTISRYMKYYNNLVASRQYKSRDYSTDRINEFYALDYNRDFAGVFKNFRTIYLDEQLDEFTNITELSENKREFKLDENYLLNYICLECPFHNNMTQYNFNEKNYKEFKICFFSHNLTEMLYHPFLYKTILCPKVSKNFNGCTEENCFYAHDFLGDFRLLPRLEREDMNEILIDCLKNEFFGFNFTHKLKANLNKIIKYSKKPKEFNQSAAKEFICNLIENSSSEFKYEILPSEFNPITYKIYKCPLEQQCKLDHMLCLNYHDNSDRRRDIREVNYGKKICKNVFDKHKKTFNNPKNCPEGDFCRHFHNLYEKIYSPVNFRRDICPNIIENNKCDYMLICPYKHKENEKDYTSDNPIFTYYNRKILKNIMQLEDEIHLLEKAKYSHMCAECSGLLSKEYYFCSPCNHILCTKCFKKNNVCDAAGCGKQIIEFNCYLIKGN